MTKINKIVMQGFKSFAKRTEIIFDDQFNCILGPNGSGKSNVLDALCFVLGKSSAKGLRAEKSSNLVYNGGKTNKPAKEGKVSIYFDNSNNTFPSDEKVVKITRIVQQSGSSKYKINDKTRTRTQVLDTLAIAKINPDGYNIVLQGDITKFVELSSQEKRKLVEEIAGISIFDEKKDKAMKELDKVDNKLGEAEIVLKERHSYLKDLKTERDQALKYKELNDKIKHNKASYLKIQINRKEDERKENQEKLDKEKQAFQELQDKIEKSKKDIETRRGEIEQISKEVEEKGETKQVSMQKEIEQLRIDIATAKTRITSHETEIGRIKERKGNLTENLKDIKEKIKEQQDSLKTLEERRKRREEERKELEKKIEDFRKKHNLDNDTTEMDSHIDKLDSQADEIQAEIQKLREKQQELFRQQDKVEFQISSIDEQIQKVKEIEKEHKKELDELKNKRDRFKKITLELNKKLDQNSRLAAEIGDSETKLHKAREELSKLEARNANIKEKVSGNIAVQKILEQKKRIQGIYGTVAELGNVSSKYSLALEVAAGPRVKSIVVKDDSVAAKCINYLKQNRLGTAGFIPLNKIKGQDENAGTYAKANGSHGRAIDLIKFDPKFKKAFSYVFGNTIVVDSVDVARRIGVGNIRMVTISGDIVETSGLMQGGYRTQQKSGAAFQEQELSQSIEEYESMVAELDSSISSKRSRKAENEEEISQLRDEKANLEGEIIKVEKGLHLKSDDLDANLKYKEDLQKQAKDLEEQADDLTAQISAKNKQLAQIKVDRQKTKEKLNELRNPRLLAELNSFEEQKSNLNQETMKLDSEIAAIKTKINDVLGRDKENTEKVVQEIDKEKVGYETQVKELKTTINEKEKTLKDKEKRLNEFYKQFKDLFAKRTKLNDEIVAIEKTLALSEEKARNQEYRINAISLDDSKIGAHLSTLYEEYAEFQDVEVDLNRSEEDLKKEVKELERSRDKIGSVNLRALDIYESVEKEYNSLVEKKEKLLSEKNDVISLMDEIEGKKKSRFMETFSKVNDHFSTIFEKLSSKGEAYLEIKDEENPFESGMIVRVKLSGSKYMDLRSLSGGEKTLTALAFIFAIQECEPATFYILDEVDAALDKRNAEKLAQLVHQYSENAQYVIISHNDAVITEASTLYGVSMDQQSGISKIVSLKV
ncbi:MAG: chromosome segregation protein SMC [Candidatus Woesearchaeota archaeon]